eukprot:TRINITY_DN31260_c0_g1_i1.p1 TRINITY_DN31260_c0_g1~~TRINITY_DN31260_c0_g1_i1.p1  ORF type:complete len:109 (+),score=1.48 TRINITY_DN31260_c0_g1_i1:77-403(+)
MLRRFARRLIAVRQLERFSTPCTPHDYELPNTLVRRWENIISSPVTVVGAFNGLPVLFAEQTSSFYLGSTFWLCHWPNATCWDDLTTQDPTKLCNLPAPEDKYETVVS